MKLIVVGTKQWERAEPKKRTSNSSKYSHSWSRSGNYQKYQCTVHQAFAPPPHVQSVSANAHLISLFKSPSEMSSVRAFPSIREANNSSRHSLTGLHQL